MQIKSIFLSIIILMTSNYVLAHRANDALISPKSVKSLDALLIARNAAYQKFPWMKNKKYFAEYSSDDKYIMVVFSIDPSQKKFLGSPLVQPVVEVQLARKKLSVLKVYIAK